MADRRNFFLITRGSLQECVPLLELDRRRGQLSVELQSRLKARLDEISRMLEGLINGLENRL
jgi:four helix bundle protein